MFLSRYWPNFCFNLIMYSLELIQNKILTIFSFGPFHHAKKVFLYLFFLKNRKKTQKVNEMVYPHWKFCKQKMHKFFTQFVIFMQL